MRTDSKIFVAGARGLVGSAIVRALTKRGYSNLITPNRSEVNLADPGEVCCFFSVFEPEYVFLAAAKVGGIKANAADPLGFFLDNMAIQTNVITSAAEYGVKKLLFLGSSCIYPKFCRQPIREEYLLTGPIEQTTEAYALAKIAGIRLCQWYYDQGHCFVSALPCNLYGPGDNFDEQTAHIVPGLISRMNRATILGENSFSVWGDGSATRELLFSEDLAEALLTVMLNYEDREHINTGSGEEYSVAVIADRIAKTVGYRGQLQFDSSQPTGTPRKIMDNWKLHIRLGWRPQHSLTDGLWKTFNAFQKTQVIKTS